MRHCSEQSVGDLSDYHDDLMGMLNLYNHSRINLEGPIQTWELELLNILGCLRFCHQRLFNSCIHFRNRSHLPILSRLLCYHYSYYDLGRIQETRFVDHLRQGCSSDRGINCYRIAFAL